MKHDYLTKSIEHRIERKNLLKKLEEQQKVLHKHLMGIRDT